jgi:hypothetical protein
MDTMEYRHDSNFGRTSKSTQPCQRGGGVDHGVEVVFTEEHVNKAADRVCCVPT